MSTKVYAVVIHEAAADELASFATPWLKRTPKFSYFYAKSVDPNGMYFSMNLEAADLVPFELQIPHAFVKAVLYAADLKRLGFTAPEHRGPAV